MRINEPTKNDNRVSWRLVETHNQELYNADCLHAYLFSTENERSVNNNLCTFRQCCICSCWVFCFTFFSFPLRWFFIYETRKQQEHVWPVPPCASMSDQIQQQRTENIHCYHICVLSTWFSTQSDLMRLVYYTQSHTGHLLAIPIAWMKIPSIRSTSFSALAGMVEPCISFIHARLTDVCVCGCAVLCQCTIAHTLVSFLPVI